jgi:predicted extracellular nuclease
MLRLRKPLLLLATVALLAPATASAELFISEYVEGSSNNKAIEIYNPSGASVSLTDYELRLRSNGALAPSQTITLSGSLAAGDVLVLVHGSAAPALLALADVVNNTVINFNGDDSVELYKISTTSTVDALGQFGVDPGTAWVSGGVTTLNATIRRNANVCQGDTNGGDVFDPAIEWTAFAVDTFDGLGAHTSACAPTPTLSNTWGRVKSLYR